MRLLITLFALTSFVCSMDDGEFSNFAETLRNKYGLDTRDEMAKGQHFRETKIYIESHNLDIMIWYKRPYVYDYRYQNIGGSPYKQLGIMLNREAFGRECPVQMQEELRCFQKGVISSVFYVPGEASKSNLFSEPENRVIHFTDEPEKLDSSVSSLNIIRDLIPDGLYDFFHDELK